jgi:hypothetical protein
MTAQRLRPAAVLALVLAVAAASPGVAQDAAPGPARHLIIVTLDGVRWQEFFGGADRDYLARDAQGNAGAAEQRFWRATPAERRATLMPFLWGTAARQGQILGDPGSGSTSRLTNGLWFSYPGYSEMLAGVADPRVDSNDKVPNPNVTVLEWLNRRKGFEGNVAAFGSWDVLPSILNVGRSGIVVGTGYTLFPAPATDGERAVNDLAADLPRYWDYGPFDAPVLYAALEHLRAKRPRVLYVLLGETDEWAHAGRYDLYLDAAFRADRFIARLWASVQAMPEYAGRTALLVTTDHGRGATKTDWTDHGTKVPAAERTWMALLGPGVPALGVRRNVTVTTSQVAATIAALLGEDFRQAVPAAAPPIDLGR